MRRTLEITGIAAIVFLLAIPIFVVIALYLDRGNAVFYTTGTTVPTIFIQNPFRDKSNELLAEEFLEKMKGKAVSDFEATETEVFFNNPSGRVETGTLERWELINRTDVETRSLFHYGIYRNDPTSKSKKPLLTFSTVKVEKNPSGWKVVSYICTGTSNNS